MWEEVVKGIFPEEIKTKDGRVVVLKILEPKDKDKLLEYFLNQISEKEISLLKENVKDASIVTKWCENINLDRVIPIVAVLDSKIVATGSLHRREFGWSRFVGKIRVTVGLSYRNIGIGSKIVGKLIELGKLLELDSIWAETFDVQLDAQKILESYGFKKEVVIRNIAIDEQSNLHNLLIYILRLK
ncbi:MAG: GNAT family N-acetyltransferase [Thermosulfidibacteraceae bacterium]|jgi:RimJ/RimL family protein N-acetyltransferase